MLTHQELLRDASRLLRPGNPQTCLNFAEGAVAAVLDDGYSVITSPNTDYIPRAPLGNATKICLKRDIFFGEEDYLVWPQYYDRALPHLPFIRLRNEDLGNPERAFLWEVLDDEDFEQYDDRSFVGLGRIKGTMARKLIDHEREIQARVEALRNPGAAQVVWDPREEKVLSDLRREVALAIDRLENVPTGIRTCRLTHRYLQRVVLELEAMGEYLMRGKGQVTVSSNCSKTVGAFVHTAQDAQQLFSSQVSYWLVRPSEQLIETRVDALMPLQEAGDRGLSTEPWSLYRPIDEGVPSTRTTYIAIHDFGADVMGWAEPFSTPGIPAFLSSRAVRRMGEGRQTYAALDRRQRGVKFTSPYALARENERGTQFSRSKFDDPGSALYPPPIPTWKNAQLNVEKETAKFIYEVCRTDMGYVLPEPAWLVATQKTEKSRAMLRSWLRYRPALLYRLSSPAFKVLPLHTDAWSALIASEYIAATARNRDADAQAYRRNKLKEELLLALGSAVGNEGEVQLGSLELESRTAQWQGVDFDNLLDVHFEQILWEMCEVNFRFEFQALNCRIAGHRYTATGKLGELITCFPGESLAVSMATANRGLASADIRERARYLFAMARVMMKWPGIDPRGWIAKREKLTWSEGDIRLLEEEIATAYTQSFFNHFRRAAILPRRLSAAAYEALAATVTPLPPILAPVLDNDPRIIINSFSV